MTQSIVLIALGPPKETYAATGTPVILGINVRKMLTFDEYHIRKTVNPQDQI
jgi:hypothetical protein